MIHTITAAPSVTTPAIEAGQMWRDEELEISYRVLSRGITGWRLRCISDETGIIWEDEMHPDAFAIDNLTLVG